MSLDERSITVIESFLRYVQDSTATDDRYGPVQRLDHDDETIFAIRFEAGPSCWLEVSVHPSIPRIRVGFLTGDRATGEEIELALQESGQTMAQFIAAAFREAGLNDEEDPPVEQTFEEGERHRIATPLNLDELPDLDRPEIRSRTLRMLEGYLIAFGPAIVDENDRGEPIEDDE